MLAGSVPEPHTLGRAPSILALAAGAGLMIHDWKDRSFWFERGYGSQP
jgi:hypothetical protein